MLSIFRISKLLSEIYTILNKSPGGAIIIFMNKLTIVANIIAKPDKIDLVKIELQKLIPLTLAEKGCIQYDLHQDNDNPAHFMFYENWESRELWQTHMNTAHLKNFQALTDGCIERFTLNEMSLV